MNRLSLKASPGEGAHLLKSCTLVNLRSHSHAAWRLACDRSAVCTNSGVISHLIDFLIFVRTVKGVTRVHGIRTGLGRPQAYVRQSVLWVRRRAVHVRLVEQDSTSLDSSCSLVSGSRLPLKCTYGDL